MKHKIRYINPLLFMLGSYLALYFLPSLFISEEILSRYSDTTIDAYRTANLTYTVSLALSCFIISIFYIIVKRDKSVIRFWQYTGFQKAPLLVEKLLIVSVILSMIITSIYFFSIGLPKLLLLGSDIDAWEFRIIGYDDVSRIFTALFEVSRRLIYPVALIYYLYKSHIFGVSKTFTKILMFFFFVASIMNLDRGPILLFITIIIYFLLSTARRRIIAVLYFFVGVLIIAFVGSVFSFLQYNNLNFNFNDVYTTAQSIIKNRIIADSSYMSLEYSFNLFSIGDEKLYLKYSRLLALVTGEYIGTVGENSIFVAPVGIVADVWRNFGMTGMFIAPILMVYIANRIRIKLMLVHDSLKTSISFLFIIFSLYTIFGGIFSMGPFAILALIFILISFKRKYPKNFIANNTQEKVK